ncbi:MAG: carbon-nitrogen family hydrolase [Oscillospiraceae bacterium]|nr:carbon-nitrogen family hydrolase [Oscillospiraceae bacterium]
MKAALCQFQIEYEEKEINLHRAGQMIAEAAKAHAEIIFFPEMSFTGFSMQVNATGESNGETLRQMREYAQAYGIAVGFGWVKKNGEKGENHYTVLDQNGTILADYVKIHPFSFSREDTYFEAGCRTAVFTFSGHTFGLFICYDLRFPEIFRAVSAKADVLVVAANWPEKRIGHWNKLLEARALENQSWVLGINCFGNQQELHYNGSSRTVNPEGETVECLIDREGMIFCEIMNESAEFRNSFPALQDRRPELYKELLNATFMMKTKKSSDEKY